MKTRKILSLALALALCLGLSIPATAAEWLYDVRIGADDYEVEPLPEDVATAVRNWEYTEQREPGTNAYLGYTYTLGDVTDYSLDSGFYLPLDEEITIRKIDGSTLDGIYLTAWSDPDGDGVHDQRLAAKVAVFDENSASLLGQLLPTDTASPIRNGKIESPLLTGDNYVDGFTDRWMFSDSNEVDFCGEVAYELNELKISTSYLARLFGKNTLLRLGFPVGEDEFFFNFLITDVPEQTPAKPEETAAVAYPSTQKVDVDGKAIEFQCYALRDAAGNDTNYIKLRDLADILNGSAAQFEVGWDGNVTITTGQSYTKNGSEQKTPFSGNRMYKEVTAQTMVNGKAADLAAFTLTDDAGGGYTYYKLRDLGAALGFKVDWTAERGIFIETK